MYTMRTGRFQFFALAAALTAAAGCGDSDADGVDAGADKVGNPPPPVTITLVTSEQPDRPGGDMVEAFVTAVDELSDGRVTIVPTFSHPAEQPSSWDQVNVRALLNGDFDMAFIPARAWHAEGVTTLEPLQLPFVVDTDEQADRVAADPTLTDALMSGLADIDVTGIGLFPEALRHLVRLDGTPISPTTDLNGLAVRAPRSDTTWELLEELGASVDDPNGLAFDEAVTANRINAAESSLIVSAALPTTGPPSVLVNIALYTKFNVLAISDAALERLDDATTAALREAAASALADTIEARPRQPAALAEACGMGLAAVFATEAEQRAWQAAAAPVIERISAEGDVSSLLARVRDVAGPGDVAELSACPETDPAEPFDSTARPEPEDIRPVGATCPTARTGSRSTET
jgi:TRAP-type C4-dicarboxylate transport system substrate-binding protein